MKAAEAQSIVPFGTASIGTGQGTGGILRHRQAAITRWPRTLSTSRPTSIRGCHSRLCRARLSPWPYLTRPGGSGTLPANASLRGSP